MADSTEHGGGLNGMLRVAGFVLSLLVAAGALFVQFGVVTQELRGVERRMNDLISEVRLLRTDYASIERRISYLEGRSDETRTGKPRL